MTLMLPYILYISIQDSGVTRGLIKTGVKFLTCGAMLQSLSGILKFTHAFNGAGWFVSTIFVCYCVSPALMRISRKIFNSRQNSRILLSTIIIITAIFRGLFLAVEERTAFDDISYSFPLVRAFYILTGMSVYQLYIQQNANDDNNGTHKRLADLREFSAAILSVIWFLARNTMEIMLNSCYIYIMDLATVSYLIFCFANESGKISKVIRQSKIVNFGKDMMYIYLYHYPIRIYTDLVFQNNRFVFGQFTGIAEVILIFLLTLIAYRLHKNFLLK